MCDVTIQTRLAAVMGLPESASDDQLLKRAAELVKQTADVNTISEREQALRDIETDANCTRETAVFVLAERERERLHPMPHGV
jgi:hypothetical protein